MESLPYVRNREGCGPRNLPHPFFTQQRPLAHAKRITRIQPLMSGSDQSRIQKGGGSMPSARR
jgi:hypothetical protein